MMKHIMRGLCSAFVLLSLLLLCAAPALAAEPGTVTDTVTVSEDGTVTLFSGHAAGERVSSVRFSLDVSAAEAEVGFSFDGALSERLTYSSADAENGLLNVYIAGTAPLMAEGQDQLVLGTLTGAASDSVKLADGSLEYVYGSRVIAQNLASEPVAGSAESAARGELQSMLDNADAVYGKDDIRQQFTSDSMGALQTAVDTANKLLRDPSTPEEDIRAALEALQIALDGLVPVGRAALDQSLSDAYEKAADSGYTQESLDALQRAIQQAESARSGDEEGWDAADEQLRRAIEGLMAAPKTRSGSQRTASPASDSDTVTGSSSSDTAAADSAARTAASGGSSPGTGDETAILPWALMLCLCGAAALELARQGRCRR